MTMKEIMNQELAEALATLNKANNALSRIFNTEEGEDEISELANLTHAKQVEQFDWCPCEDSDGVETVYPDCPARSEEGNNE